MIIETRPPGRNAGVEGIQRNSRNPRNPRNSRNEVPGLGFLVNSEGKTVGIRPFCIPCIPWIPRIPLDSPYFYFCLSLALCLIGATVSGKFQDDDHSGHETGPDACALEHGASVWRYALFAASIGVLLLLNGLGIFTTLFGFNTALFLAFIAG